MNQGILGQSKKIQKEKNKKYEIFTKEEKRQLVRLYEEYVVLSLNNGENKFDEFIQEFIPLYV